MPVFEFEDKVEPVTVKIGDDEFHAMPGIPANDFKAFMDLFARIPPLIVKLRGGGDDDRALPAGSPPEGGALPSGEGTEPGAEPGNALVPVSEADQEAVAAEAARRQEEQVQAYMDFIALSLEGLELVMQPESLARLNARASDKERPIEAATLANVFSTLAAFYVSGGRESEAAQGSGPTDAASASSPSSDTTGGSSEGNSSPVSEPTALPDSTTTT
jgi:hypothetical protein